MTEAEILKNLLSKQFALKDEELQSLLYQTDEKDPNVKVLKPDAFDELVKRDEARVARLRQPDPTKLDEYFNNGYKKGQKEISEKFEKKLREQFKVEDTLTGDDLIIEIVKKKNPAMKDLDDETIKAHPAFLSREKAIREEYEKTVQAKETEFAQFKTQVENEKMYGRVKSDLWKTVSAMKPILPKNTTAAENIKADFMAKIQNYQFNIDENGNHTVLKDGKRLEDQHGNPLSFESFAKQLAVNYFDFEVQDPKGGGGAGSGGNDSIVYPTTEAEYVRMLANEPDKKKRIQIMEFWQKKSKK